MRRGGGDPVKGRGRSEGREGSKVSLLMQGGVVAVRSPPQCTRGSAVSPPPKTKQ